METNMLIGILIGSGTVALLAFFAYRVKASFDRVTRNNEELNTRVFKSINDIHQSIDEVYRSIDSRFDEASQSIDSRFDEVHQSFDEVYRSIDSRFDKTEARLKTELSANQLESQLTSK
jgi:uncharacterized damage-inducible protein DinB